MAINSARNFLSRRSRLVAIKIVCIKTGKGSSPPTRFDTLCHNVFSLFKSGTAFSHLVSHNVDDEVTGFNTISSKAPPKNNENVDVNPLVDITLVFIVLVSRSFVPLVTFCWYQNISRKFLVQLIFALS